LSELREKYVRNLITISKIEQVHQVKNKPNKSLPRQKSILLFFHNRRIF